MWMLENASVNFGILRHIEKAAIRCISTCLHFRKWFRTHHNKLLPPGTSDSNILWMLKNVLVDFGVLGHIEKAATECISTCSHFRKWFRTQISLGYLQLACNPNILWMLVVEAAWWALARQVKTAIECQNPLKRAYVLNFEAIEDDEVALVMWQVTVRVTQNPCQGYGYIEGRRNPTRTLPATHAGFKTLDNH